MECLMCTCSEGNLQEFQGGLDIETTERIKYVLPDFMIPESMDPVLICSTCREQVSIFSKMKTATMKNSSRLKYLNAKLKGTNNLKCKELRVLLNSDQVSAQNKHHLEFKIDPESNYLLSWDKEEATRIIEDDDLKKYEINLNHLQDDGSGSSTKKDSNLTSSDSIDGDQPRTQNESQKKRFKCSDCRKTFTEKSKLKTHSRVHTKKKSHKCTTCQKAFTHLSNLNKHILTHAETHECDVCNKTFSRKTYLKLHKLIHDNVRPFKCDVCDKAFIKSCYLTIHKLIHTGEKLYECHFCEYKCTTGSNLKTHIRRHTGEKPFSCKRCEKSFTTTSGLKQHERRHHSNGTSD